MEDSERNINGNKVHFRHYHRTNGERLTICFIRVDKREPGDTRQFVASYSRYNPKHEAAPYTKRKARHIAFERLRKTAGTTKDAFVVQVAGERTTTYATELVNALVDARVLPSHYAAAEPRDARRYRDYSWDAERGLVRSYGAST